MTDARPVRAFLCPEESMSKPRYPAHGGSYFKPAPDSEPIFVAGTDRRPTEHDKRALEAAKKPKAKSTETGGEE